MASAALLWWTKHSVSRKQSSWRWYEGVLSSVSRKALMASMHFS